MRRRACLVLTILFLPTLGLTEPRLDLFAEGDGEYFFKVIDVQITFGGASAPHVPTDTRSSERMLLAARKPKRTCRKRS